MLETSRNIALAISLLILIALTPASAQRPAFDELMGRAEKALAAGDLNKAITLYEKLANFYPKSAAAHNRLGFAHYKKGNDARAIYSFRRSLSLARNNEEALHNLVLASGRQADNLTREARFAEAAQNLDELIAHYSWHPQYSVLLYYRGRLEFLRGQPENAMVWWKKAANNAPQSNVAKIVAAQQRPLDEKTLALYTEATANVKTEPAFDYLLGNRFLDERRAEDASKAFAGGLAKCREARIPFPLLSLKAAQAELAAGDPPAAVEILEEAKLQRPDWASIRTLLWAAYLAAGDEAQADQALQEAYELDGRPKLALLGDPSATVGLKTASGSMQLAGVTAVSPSAGAATLNAGDQAITVDIKPGDVLVYRLSQGQLALESQATLSRQGKGEGALAPPLVEKDRRGHLYRLADALLKRPVVIVFWAADKPNALKMLNGLGGLQARYAGDLETVAIHTNPKAQKEAERLYLSQPGTSAQLWGDGATGKGFGVTAVPAVVLIDRYGRIVRRELKPTQALFQELPSVIDNLP